MTTGRRRQTKPQADGNGATTAYEADLWRMDDSLRGNMDAAEYKHVVLGLIFSSTSPTPSRRTYAQLELQH